LSQWLHAAMAEAGLAVELLETRHVRTAFKTMPVKTDKKDARGIAQLMRLGWFRPVHCKSLPAQEVRAVLTARKLLQGKLHDVEMCSVVHFSDLGRPAILVFAPLGFADFLAMALLFAFVGKVAQARGASSELKRGL
jgi:hypothetical protein